ncbi:MAG: hypothetical protein ACREX8_16335, partial [Gammaproteobacteria bacterium]
GRQVVAGARSMAADLGLTVICGNVPDTRLSKQVNSTWDLFCAGSFEEDVDAIASAFALAQRPRLVGAVAAGVREFGQSVARNDGVYGVAQWFPGRSVRPALGPSESDFLLTYSAPAGTVPDYPAIQAVAAAVIAAHCARTAGSISRASLWAAATELRTTTLYGDFRIDPVTGTQLGHETVLLRWTENGLTPEPA